VKRPSGLAKNSVLALVAGAAAALAHPPFGLLPGLLGYGLLAALSDRPDPVRPWRSAFWRGWLAGTAYFLIGCWWVAQAFLVDAADQGWMAPFAVALLAGGLGLFWGLASLLYAWVKPIQPIWKALVFAGCLSAAEWLRGHVLTGFPWDLPGESWAAGSAPSQAAAVLGAYGLTWLTLALAVAIGAPLAFGRGRHRLVAAGVGVTALAALYGFGLQRLSHAAPAALDAPVLRIVQADVPQTLLEDSGNFQIILSRYLRLTTQPAVRRPTIVIWPEGALPDSANDMLDARSWVQGAIGRALGPDQLLLMGSYRLTGPPQAPKYFNSLLALRRQGDGLALKTFYDKYRLVPFGEYLPLDTLMGALGIKKLVHVGDGFSAGPPPAPILAPGAPAMQPLICYEALFPGFTRQGEALTGIRARWIVNVSDDAWFGPTSGPWQHLNLASYRAIEEGLPVIRSTPTGVSAVIDAYGRSPKALRLGLGAQGVIDAPLPPALAPTPYSRFGDAPFVLMLALSLVAACSRLSPFARARLQT
jgi:apolipoprotein N-acyltransferase